MKAKQERAISKKISEVGFERLSPSLDKEGIWNRVKQGSQRKRYFVGKTIVSHAAAVLFGIILSGIFLESIYNKDREGTGSNALKENQEQTITMAVTADSVRDEMVGESAAIPATANTIQTKNRKSANVKSRLAIAEDVPTVGDSLLTTGDEIIIVKEDEKEKNTVTAVTAGRHTPKVIHWKTVEPEFSKPSAPGFLARVTDKMARNVYKNDDEVFYKKIINSFK